MTDSTSPSLIDEATRCFIAEHTCADVRQLALQARRWPEVDMALALDQIAGRALARRKLPTWAGAEGVVYPPRLALEQCSSEATASYKAALLPPVGRWLVDLTGGLGVDCAAMAPQFSRVTYVERQEQLCRLASHNFAALGLPHIEVVNTDAVAFLHTLPAGGVSAIYIDPSRRDAAGRRTYGIADCQPNVAVLAPELLRKAPLVMVKLSPMLDVSQALAALPAVSDVHIVSTDGECKELLLLMRRGHSGPPMLHCAADGRTLTVEWGSEAPPAPVWDGEWRPGMWLHVPGPSVMKAGCFAHVAHRHGLAVVSPYSHLMVGGPVDGFEGRSFQVVAVTSLNKRELKQTLSGVEQANVAVRHFPLSAAELKRRLHVRDGGDTYIFGTTTAQGRRVLIVAEKR